VRLALAAAALPGIAPALSAQDPFEIQVYDSDTAPRGQAGIEVHANYFIRGIGAMGPVLPTDGVFHLTFEPHLGVTEWAEMGGYLQTAMRPDGSFEYGGAKLRFKARLPNRAAGLVGFALNTEIAAIPRSYSDSRFGMELRPIIDLWADRFYLSVNPIVDIDYEGNRAGQPQFEPAAKGDWLFMHRQLGLGIEYYSAIGPVTDPTPPSQQVHRLFAVIDLQDLHVGSASLAINAGLGYGVAAGERWIVKLIVGVDLGGAGTNP